MEFDTIKTLTSSFQDICEANSALYTASITTNGYLLTEDIVSQIKDLDIKYIQITLDGPPQYHNRRRPLKGGGETFLAIFKNILNVIKNTDIKTLLKINVDSQNMGSIPELLEMFPKQYRKKLWVSASGIFSASRERVSSSGHFLSVIAKDAIEKGFTYDLPHPKIYYCGSNRINTFLVDPELKLYKCTVDFENGHPVGHITQEGRGLITTAKLADWVLPIEDPACAECKALPLCAWGCRLNRLSNSRSCQLPLEEWDEVIKLRYLSLKLESRSEKDLSIFRVLGGEYVFE